MDYMICSLIGGFFLGGYNYWNDEDDGLIGGFSQGAFGGLIFALFFNTGVLHYIFFPFIMWFY